jgi:hypothetical protein
MTASWPLLSCSLGANILPFAVDSVTSQANFVPIPGKNEHIIIIIPVLVFSSTSSSSMTGIQLQILWCISCDIKWSEL